MRTRKKKQTSKVLSCTSSLLKMIFATFMTNAFMRKLILSQQMRLKVGFVGVLSEELPKMIWITNERKKSITSTCCRTRASYTTPNLFCSLKYSALWSSLLSTSIVCLGIRRRMKPTISKESIRSSKSVTFYHTLLSCLGVMTFAKMELWMSMGLSVLPQSCCSIISNSFSIVYLSAIHSNFWQTLDLKTSTETHLLHIG